MWGVLREEAPLPFPNLLTKTMHTKIIKLNYVKHLIFYFMGKDMEEISLMVKYIWGYFWLWIKRDYYREEADNWNIFSNFLSIKDVWEIMHYSEFLFLQYLNCMRSDLHIFILSNSHKTPSIIIDTRCFRSYHY